MEGDGGEDEGENCVYGICTVGVLKPGAPPDPSLKNIPPGGMFHNMFHNNVSHSLITLLSHTYHTFSYPTHYSPKNCSKIGEKPLKSA